MGESAPGLAHRPFPAATRAEAALLTSCPPRRTGPRAPTVISDRLVPDRRPTVAGRGAHQAQQPPSTDHDRFSCPVRLKVAEVHRIDLRLTKYVWTVQAGIVQLYLAEIHATLPRPSRTPAFRLLSFRPTIVRSHRCGRDRPVTHRCWDWVAPNSSGGSFSHGR